MSGVVLETAVSTIYSATSYYLQYAVFFRVLPCVIAAPVYYAVFFRVGLLLRAYYDSLVSDPGSRSRLQPRAQHRALCAGKCSINTFYYVLHLVCMIFGTTIPTLFNILMKMFLLLCNLLLTLLLPCCICTPPCLYDFWHYHPYIVQYFNENVFTLV